MDDQSVEGTDRTRTATVDVTDRGLNAGGDATNTSGAGVASATTTDDEELLLDEAEDLNLGTFFRYIRKTPTNAYYKCKLCPAGAGEKSTSIKSNGNLKKHFKKMHPHSLNAFEAFLTERTRRKRKPEAGDDQDQPSEGSALKQRKITDSSASGKTGGNVSQAKVDSLILKYVINSYKAFHTVEDKNFIGLVKGLCPSRTIMCRKTFVSRMNDEYTKMKEELTSDFTNVQYICTTADAWSGNHRAFMGITAHWLDEKTLARRSVVLACKRTKDSHTYNKIASELFDCYTEYNVQNKVIKTVTDNASNFVKAFNEYGMDFNVGQHGFLDVGEDREGDDDLALDAVNIHDILQGADDDNGNIHLYSHQRCAAHTLNLVATTDCKAALNNAAYKKIVRSTQAKCSAMWNKSSRSVQAHGFIRDTIGIACIIPNDTRWSSTFYAYERLLQMFSKMPQLDAICDKLGLPRFLPEEVQYVGEYAKCMKFVAVALDKMQAEENCFLGHLLPTIVSLKNQLRNILNTNLLRYCGPLINALLEGLTSRFQRYFEDADCIIAGILIPRFKLKFLETQASQDNGKMLVRDALRSLILERADRNNPVGPHGVGVVPPAVHNAENDNFFCFNGGDAEIAQNQDSPELQLYLTCPDDTLNIYSSFPLLKKLFLRYNTALPSSAPVERLFSQAARIFMPKRNRLDDENFEKQLLLACNNNQKVKQSDKV